MNHAFVSPDRILQVALSIKHNKSFPARAFYFLFPIPCSLPLVFRHYGIVALAHLHLHPVPPALDGELAEASVLLGVGGRVGGNVLSP